MVVGAAIGAGLGHLLVLLVLNLGAPVEGPPAPPPRADFRVTLQPLPPARPVARKRRVEWSARQAASPGHAASAPPLAAAPPTVETAPPDYGRWTFRGGAAPGVSGGLHARAGCDPAVLPTLSEAARRACEEDLKAIAEREGDEFAERGAHGDWRSRSPLMPCSKALTKRLSLELCRGLGVRYRF